MSSVPYGLSKTEISFVRNPAMIARTSLTRSIPRTKIKAPTTITAASKRVQEGSPDIRRRTLTKICNDARADHHNDSGRRRQHHARQPRTTTNAIDCESRQISCARMSSCRSALTKNCVYVTKVVGNGTKQTCAHVGNSVGD